MFSALVFFLFLPLLKRTETISIDTDWLYRKGLVRLLEGVTAAAGRVAEACDLLFVRRLPGVLGRWSRRPLSLVLISYTKMKGAGREAPEVFEGGAPPESVSLQPMGVPVMIGLFSFLVLFMLFVLFF
jgi:multicomponent Na+:H+ antiporter subunit D